MNNYLKIFQEEAKILLHSYKNKDAEACKRCQKVFGTKTDLTLMNMQHIIAKEHGFHNWNEIRQASRSQQAEALTKQKSKQFTSPLTEWFGNKSVLEDYENNQKKPYLENKAIDWNNLTVKMPYQSIDLSNMDVSGHDLSTLNLLDATFTDNTIWPTNKSFLPKGIEPNLFLEQRKNPGLGIKALHKQQIKGKGRNIVLISQFGLSNHTEFHHNLMDYIEIADNKIIGGYRSNGDVSGLVGQTCGIAPESNLYYIAVKGQNHALKQYAQAIQKSCEIHQNLISKNQNGIDVIVTHSGITFSKLKDQEGYSEVMNAIKTAEDMGIFVKAGDYPFENQTVGIFCKMEGNVENPTDYEIQSYWDLLKTNPQLYNNLKIIYFPAQWTVAGDVKMDSFVFNKTTPGVNIYVAGLYLLAKSVKNTLTPSEFYQFCYETGDKGMQVGRIINAEHLIKFLKK